MVQKGAIKPKLLIIAGPTCVGKSSTAIKLAKEYNGEIVSCDSMQIYRGCDIVTAKIKKEEMLGISHYMLDVVDAKDEFSVSAYKDMATAYIKDIISRNKLPILVGGTGLYIDAIIKDFNFNYINKNEIIRNKYQEYLQKNGCKALYELLLQKNKEVASKIDKHNSVRIIRALEVLEQNGNEAFILDGSSNFDYFYCVLNKDRELLYQDINNRVESMVQQGAIEEVKMLLNNGVTFSNQCMKSIGYKEWQPYLLGSATERQTIDIIKQHTRNYAKRQLTWFRHRDGVKFYDVLSNNFYNQLTKDINTWLGK